MTETHDTDVVIIGAGPVGLFAIFELGMLKVKCHVVDALDAVGGQCTALYPEKPIFDIPAHPSINGEDLVKQLEEQAAPFDPVYHLDQQVTGITPLSSSGATRGSDSEDARVKHEHDDIEGWKVTTSKDTEITCKAVMIAAGCGAFGPNRPPLDGLEAYEATGHIRYMVTKKDEFRGKNVVIAGGGDSAVDWANLLSDIAANTYVVHRRDKFRAMAESVDQMRNKADVGQIEMVVPYQLDGLEGENGELTGVKVKTLDGEERMLEADYLLPFYGLSMDLGPIANWGLNVHMNHIEVDPATCETSQQGIYAVGDIATYKNKLKLILCGFSEAAMAAHHIRDLVYPDTAYHFEYSTSKGVPGEAA